MSATLEDLEASFRERQAASSARLVIVAMQIPEADIRTLRPRLERDALSLSELVRELLRSAAKSTA